MSKIKISVVSYINSLPFIYGLENTDIINEIDLQKDIPSICADKLINNQVDIGLIPIAALPYLNNYKIISEYCISSSKKVDSVFLFANCDLNEIDTIILDYQSNTSNNLSKILSKHYWKISPVFIKGKQGYINKIKDKTAGIIIGDRCFQYKNNFVTAIDLAEEWYKFTKLPFVFAVWTSNKNISKEFIKTFNQSLKTGINNINKLKNTSNFLNDNEFLNYLNQNINYNLNKNKQIAIEKYINLLNSL